MIKRLFWFLMGAGLSLWLTRTVRQKVQRFAPPNVLRGLTDDLRAAAREGREGMRAREHELRSRPN